MVCPPVLNPYTTVPPKVLVVRESVNVVTAEVVIVPLLLTTLLLPKVIVFVPRANVPPAVVVSVPFIATAPSRVLVPLELLKFRLV